MAIILGIESTAHTFKLIFVQQKLDKLAIFNKVNLIKNRFIK
ncbi:Uncharacterised protein [uncultured archaeon]|nr:Uncharacterised protein [uncultured archaeon]